MFWITASNSIHIFSHFVLIVKPNIIPRNSAKRLLSGLQGTMKLVANSLSVLRILLIIPVVFLLFRNQHVTALVVFLVAAATDVLDGWIARKTRTVTNIGKWLDPIADKLLVISMFVFFFFRNEMPAWGFFVLSRDVLVILGSLKQTKLVPPTFLGKTTTFLQAVTVAAMIMEFSAPSLLLFVSFISFVSGIEYFLLYTRLSSHSIRSLDSSEK